MSSFHFQQFSVVQNRSAMKVCTDAVLFAAMAPVNRGAHVLDIGAGTGVLSLMAAQLGAAHVTAVELTQPGHEEAQFNFQQSPWADRLRAVHQDIQSFANKSSDHYDLIICNPPFFENHSKATDTLRHIARHNDQLPYEDLIKSAEHLLSEQGVFYVLLPVHAIERFTQLAKEVGLHLSHRTDFRGYSHNNAKVSALRYCRSAAILCKTLLTIYAAHNVYSQESERYLSAFLLRFSKL